MYTNGGCFVPWMVDPHTEIGRYSSIAARGSHRQPQPSAGFQGHLFFNPANGLCDRWLVDHNPLEIDHRGITSMATIFAMPVRRF
jgi:hypothetical protein